MSDRPATPFFGANWKMHKGPTAARRFAESFTGLHGPREDRTVVFFPPSISLAAFREGVEGRTDLGLGVQDVHQEAEGAHTGAISARMAADAGARWALAGHSERRREFGDSDERVALKTLRLMDEGLRPILCVGETLEEREEGRLEEVLQRQVRAVLEALPAGERGTLVYAYEPVWAIGTGRSARPEDASEAHGRIRDVVAGAAGATVAADAVILYGGSVKPDNAGELMAAEGVDGALVGSASLDPEAFAVICAV